MTRLSVGIFLVMLLSGPFHAQKPCKRKLFKPGQQLPGISVEQYHEILDLLMPRSIPVVGGQVRSVFTIRVEPSFEGEFQYTFIKRNEGKVEIIKRVANQNIYYFVPTLLCAVDDEITTEDAARQVPNKLMNFTISAAKFDGLIDSFEAAVRDHNAGSAVRAEREKSAIKADGTTYLFRIEGEKKYDVRVDGTSITWPPPEEGESPLISWLRRMRGEVGF